MGFLDLGSQILSFDFKQEATSPGFNKINVGLVKPGLYKGGKVTLNTSVPSNPTWDIAPMNLAMRTLDPDGRDLLVSVITQSTISLNAFVGGQYAPLDPLLENDYKIITKLDWINLTNNYADFLVLPVTTSYYNEIIICRLTAQGGSPPGNPPKVTYDITTYGTSYEGTDERSSNPILNKEIRYSGESFRLNLKNHADGESIIPLESEIALPIISGNLTIVEEDDAFKKVRVDFVYSKNNAISVSPVINSNINIQYTAGYKVSSDGSYPFGYLSVFQDDTGKLRIRNRLGSDKVFLCHISANTFKQIF